MTLILKPLEEPLGLFNLYWSNLSKYEGCPQAFLWGRGWPTIDCGGGLGKKKPMPEIKRSEHSSALGTVIQAVIEKIYNEEQWKHPAYLKEHLVEWTREAFDKELNRRYIDYREAPPRSEMFDQVLEAVNKFFGTMKANKLIGPYAKCEVELSGYLRPWLPIAGRVDFLIRREVEGTWIMDGKNSKRYKQGESFITYTDPDQLRWYALCFKLAYQTLPDKLGFIYYRYPYGDPVIDVNGKVVPDVVEKGVEWVPFTPADIKGLEERAIQARQGMDREKFEAKPSPQGCKFCDYESVCPQRAAQKLANSRNRKPKVTPTVIGIEEFGFD